MEQRNAPDIFDRRRRRALRARADGKHAFLIETMAEEIGERLSIVKRDFERILLIGPAAREAALLRLGAPTPIVAALDEAEAADGAAIMCEEDRLPFADASFDLVISAGTLDSVNDLPGALVLIRRVLKPDGLFLGAMFGAGSLTTLKSCMIAADGDRASAHVHPQIDVRSAGDLLARAGFALPVADGETMNLRYSSLDGLRCDLRAAGVGNALAGPRAAIGKAGLARARAKWESLADNEGKVRERIDLIYLSGWAPAPSQPKPAKRGSGSVSLAQALRK